MVEMLSHQLRVDQAILTGIFCVVLCYPPVHPNIRSLLVCRGNLVLENRRNVMPFVWSIDLAISLSLETLLGAWDHLSTANIRVSESLVYFVHYSRGKLFSG